MTLIKPKPTIPSPLAGVRILDFSTLLPGPFATVVLADLGAEVIKVEAPEGDPARTTPGAAKFPGVNRNKRSIGIDLKKSDARPIVNALIDRCDVVVEGFRPGVAERLGIGYEDLSKRKPEIIYCSVSGYGQTGPWRDMPGHDPNYLAASGAMTFSGHWLGEPGRSSLPVSDLVGGAFAAISILSALRTRDSTGRGGWLDLSLFESAMFCSAARFGLDANAPNRDLLRPTNDIFKTADGRSIAIGVNEPHIWRTFCSAVAEFLPELADAKFGNEEGRRKYGDELAGLLQKLFAQRSREAWVSYLRPKDIPIQPCLAPAEAAKSEQVVARELIAHLGDYSCVLFPTRMDGKPLGVLQRREPRKGEHTREITDELGLDQVKIDELIQNGVLYCDSEPQHSMRSQGV